MNNFDQVIVRLKTELAVNSQLLYRLKNQHGKTAIYQRMKSIQNKSKLMSMEHLISVKSNSDNVLNKINLRERRKK